MSGGPRGACESTIPGRVAVVGVCAAGKTTLVRLLRAAGYDARSCAQEHSYVADMWRRLARPQALVYLDAALATINARSATSYDSAYIDTQRQRLEHAREHCDVYVRTDGLDPSQVCAQVIAALGALGVKPSARRDNAKSF